MGTAHIYKKVKTLLEDGLQRDMYDGEMNLKLNELGLDSLDLVNVVSGLEDEHGIKIPSSDLPKLTAGTGMELVIYVQSKIEAI